MQQGEKIQEKVGDFKWENSFTPMAEVELRPETFAPYVEDTTYEDVTDLDDEPNNVL